MGFQFRECVQSKAVKPCVYGLLMGLTLSCSVAPPERPQANGQSAAQPANKVEPGQAEAKKKAPKDNGQDSDPTGDDLDAETDQDSIAEMDPGSDVGGMPKLGEDPKPKPTPAMNPMLEPKTPAAVEVKKSLLFVSGGSAKIGVYQFDKATGKAVLLKTTSTPNASPSFLAIHPKKKLLFAANESGNSIMAFRINTDSGELTALNSQAMPDGPAHVSVDPEGKWVFAASYNGGRAASFPIGADGKLGSPSSDLFAGKNAHAVHMSGDGKQVWVPCLGSNYIAQYSFSANGQWVPATPATVSVGSGGPRHMDAHPNGKWAYLLNEYSSSVQAFVYDGSTLKLSGSPVSALSAQVSGNSGAEIQVHPSGKFLYTSNRGDNSIAIFAIGATGAVTLSKTVKTGGKIPRHFAVDETGAWMTVANQSEGGVTIFGVNAASGDLTAKSGNISFDSAQYSEVFDFTE